MTKRTTARYPRLKKCNRQGDCEEDGGKHLDLAYVFLRLTKQRLTLIDSQDMYAYSYTQGSLRWVGASNWSRAKACFQDDGTSGRVHILIGYPDFLCR